MTIMNNCNKAPVNMRRALRLMDGGDVQVPQGPGMDRAGFEARNPRVAEMQAASRTPGAIPTFTPPGVSPMPVAAPQFGPGRVDDTQNAALTERMAMYGRASAATNGITAMQNGTAPAPVATPAVASPIAKPARSPGKYAAADFSLPGNTFTPMDVPQLRDGGPAPVMPNASKGGWVPGEGEGDKTRALLEKDEFVVSREMLDAQPELREHLHDLRGNVLAAKGKSVEQADAEAVSGGTLRAEDGGEFTERLKKLFPNGGASLLETTGQEPLPQAAQTADKIKQQRADKRYFDYAAEEAHGNRMHAEAAAADADAKAQNAARFGQADTPPRTPGMKAIPERMSRVQKGLAWVDDAVGAVGKTQVGKLAMAAIDSPVGKFASKVGGVGGTAMLHTNDAGAPELDAERVAALSRPYNPDWQPAGGPKHTPVPDQTASTEQRTGLRLNDRDQLSPQQDPRLLNADTSRPELGASKDRSVELNGAKGPLPAGLREGVIYKTVDAQGRVTYSGGNVKGETGSDGFYRTQMVDGMGRDLKMRGSVEVLAPGSVAISEHGYAGTPLAKDPQARAAQHAAGQAKIDASLRNPDGSTWSAQDNAIMAANLRDGADPYRGTSRQQGSDEHAQVRALANSPVGTIGRRGAMARLSEIEKNETAENVANATKRATGDAAARAQNNSDRSHLLALAKEEREVKEDERKGAERADKTQRDNQEAGIKSFKDSFGTGPEADVMAKQAWEYAVRAHPGYATMAPTEQAKYRADVISNMRLMMTARSKQNRGASSLVLPDTPLHAPLDADALRNGDLERIGFWNGVFRENDEQHGDAVFIDRNGGPTRNFGNMTAEDRKWLIERQQQARAAKQ